MGSSARSIQIQPSWEQSEEVNSCWKLHTAPFISTHFSCLIGESQEVGQELHEAGEPDSSSDTWLQEAPWGTSCTSLLLMGPEAAEEPSSFPASTSTCFEYVGLKKIN